MQDRGLRQVTKSRKSKNTHSEMASILHKRMAMRRTLVVLFLFFLNASVLGPVAASGNECDEQLVNPVPWDQFADLRAWRIGRRLIQIGGAIDYVLGVAKTLPPKVRHEPSVIDSRARTLFALSEQSQSEVGLIETVTTRGLEILGDYFKGDSSNLIDSRKATKSLVEMMAMIKAKDIGHHIKRFRFRHSHPGMAPTVPYFSRQDIRSSLLLKALMEVAGFSHVDLELQIVFRRFDAPTLEAATIVFPADMRHDKKDYRLTNKIEKSLFFFSEMPPQLAMEFLVAHVKDWPDGKFDNNH